MSCNDIDAARKLIAQFHGKACGRHNSNFDFHNIRTGVRSGNKWMIQLLNGDRWYSSGMFVSAEYVKMHNLPFNAEPPPPAPCSGYGIYIS